MKTETIIKLISAASLAIVLVGCGSSDNNPDDGRIRFINAIPSTATTPVTVKMNGANVANATNVAFGSATAASFSAPAGTQSFQIVQTSNGAVVMNSTPLAIQTSIDQLVVASGGPGAVTLTNLGRTDLDTNNVALTGNSRVYFVNAATGTPVDFSFAVQGSAQPGSPTAIQDVLQNRLTNETLVGVGTGTATFTSNVNGTIDNSTPITLEGTKTYVVILYPDASVAGAYDLKVVKLN